MVNAAGHELRQKTFVRQEKLLRADDQSKSHWHPLLEPYEHKQTLPSVSYREAPHACLRIREAEYFHTCFTTGQHAGHRFLVWIAIARQTALACSIQCTLHIETMRL